MSEQLSRERAYAPVPVDSPLMIAWEDRVDRVRLEKANTNTSPSSTQKLTEILSIPAAALCRRCNERPARIINGIALPCEACSQAQLDAEEAESLQQEAMKRRRDLRNNLEAIGVNVRKYVDQQPACFDAFDASHDARALEAAQSFTNGFCTGRRTSLYLFGERPGESIACGNGKTMLAVAVLRELALDPTIPITSLKFVFVPELLLDIQDTFDNPQRRTLGIVNRYVKPELLVWDDLGAEKMSDFAVRTLYTILYKREGRANLFTSNLSLDDIKDRDDYAKRITSRIAGDARLVKLTGPDRRPLLRAV